MDDMKEQLFMRRIKYISGLEQDSEEVNIIFEDGSSLYQYHESDCCESVAVHQVDGNPSAHIGATAIDLIEKCRAASRDEVDESGTWTFYTLKTSKGYLDWRWLGESNGYYSEHVTSEFHEPNQTQGN